jgi:hypothetical protein
MRSDQITNNGLTCEKLDTSQTAVQDTKDSNSTSYSMAVTWGIRVYKRASGGSETEITSGTPVAQVTRSSDGEGLQSNTWNCPETALTSGDSIIVRVHRQYAGQGSWTTVETWQTEDLPDNQKLDAATWTIYYYTYRLAVYAEEEWTTYWWFSHGTSTYNSRIANFTYSTATILKTVTDALTLTDAISELTKFLLKTVTDALTITDVVLTGILKLKIVSDTLTIHDRAYPYFTPPSFGNYPLPHITEIRHGDTSLFAENTIPDSEIANREILGATGDQFTVSGWLLDADRADMLAMTGE